MCGTWRIFLYSNLHCSKLYVIEIVGKIFNTENIRIKGNSTKHVKLYKKYLFSDYKIR